MGIWLNRKSASDRLGESVPQVEPGLFQGFSRHLASRRLSRNDSSQRVDRYFSGNLLHFAMQISLSAIREQLAKKFLEVFFFSLEFGFFRLTLSSLLFSCPNSCI